MTHELGLPGRGFTPIVTSYLRHHTWGELDDLGETATLTCFREVHFYIAYACSKWNWNFVFDWLPDLTNQIGCFNSWMFFPWSIPWPDMLTTTLGLFLLASLVRLAGNLQWLPFLGLITMLFMTCEYWIVSEPASSIYNIIIIYFAINKNY